MANLEIQLGHVTFVGEVAGNHIHVTVLGIGAPGHRPLLGKLTMAGLEWSSLEMLVELKAISDRRELTDRAELARLDGLVAKERQEHRATCDMYMPVDSVISDWDWRGIVSDGCFRADYERAIEQAAKAFADVEAAKEKRRNG